MKYLRFAPILSLFAICAAHAQRGDPEPIPDFTNLDEYIYEPKSTLSIGVRTVSGVKTSFKGQGLIKSATEDISDSNTPRIPRTYHDGSVFVDTRGTAVDNGDGTSTFVPLASDGKTNSWTFSDDRQSSAFPGYIAMHNYSASVVDPVARTKSGGASGGLELVVSRDMGKLFNSHFTWSLTAGMTISDINVKSTNKVLANITTITDLYSLYGVVAPAAPYTAPSTTTTTVTDSGGNPVLNADGTTQTATTDTTVLISDAPADRSTKTTADNTSVTNRSTVKGAYYSFRAGPTIVLPIGQRFQASVSFGGTLVYAGSNYTVVQTFQPELGAEITDSLSGDTNKILPGYFADATMQFNITSRTGLYAGAIYQQSGDYTQKVATATSSYSTKLDFGSQSGFRAGMTIKF